MPTFGETWDQAPWDTYPWDVGLTIPAEQVATVRAEERTETVKPKARTETA